jgi:hypothetical protein
MISEFATISVIGLLTALSRDMKQFGREVEACRLGFQPL